MTEQSASIVLNGRAAARREISGVERTAIELLGRLRKIAPQLYTVMSPRTSRGGALAGHAWEQLALPARAKRMGALLVYCPANLGPLLGPPSVVVLHDASVWKGPASFSTAYSLWHKRVEAAAARRATQVVTVSEFSRRELVEVLDLDPDRVAVIPNGVDERFTPSADPAPACDAHGLSRPYVLTVATARTQKNLGVLGPLAQHLAPQGIDVVWAGGARDYLPSAPVDGGVRPLGYVADEHLPGLYAGARAFVLPSLYEGFGITCIEAMACGTPVVAADRAALPETCAGAALLVDPDDGRELVEAVQAAVSDASCRERLRGAGLERAAQLSWDQAAAKTDVLLRDVAQVDR